MSEAVPIPLHEGSGRAEEHPPLSSFKPVTLDHGKAVERVEDVMR
jgi:hypothetical protein